jgi:competence protein ComGC
MKPRCQKQRNRALTLPEVLVVIVILIFLTVIVIPPSNNIPRAQRINCVNNLKQIDVSLRIWAGDNNDKYPMSVSVTNGGAMEWIATNNVVACLRIMSNYLTTPMILACPADFKHIQATNFESDFNASHISYFIGADLDEDNPQPQRIMSGDDNFQLNGNLIGSGVLSLSTNTPIEWGPGRHGDDPNRHFWTPPPKHFVGNLGFADGSVAEEGDSGLQGVLQQTGLVTNRLAIP